MGSDHFSPKLIRAKGKLEKAAFVAVPKRLLEKPECRETVERHPGDWVSSCAER